MTGPQVEPQTAEEYFRQLGEERPVITVAVIAERNVRLLVVDGKTFVLYGNELMEQGDPNATAATS